MASKYQDFCENDSEIDQWRAAFRQLILSFGSGLRHTQDSPVLSDVWLFYANNPGEPAPLIIVPDYKTESGELLRYFLGRIRTLGGKGASAEQHSDPWAIRSDKDVSSDLNMFALSNDVSANVPLDTLINIFVPRTNWWLWEARVGKHLDTILQEANYSLTLNDKGFREAILMAFRKSKEKEIWRFLAIIGLLNYADSMLPRKRGKRFSKASYRKRWSTIGEVSQALLNISEGKENRLSGQLKAFIKHALRSIGDGWVKSWKSAEDSKTDDDAETLEELSGTSMKRQSDQRQSIWKINLNRDFNLSLTESRRTVKADAAERVFEHSTSGIVWAIIDSGVDATHPAFGDRCKRATPAATGQLYDIVGGNEFTKTMASERVKNSRVLATFDFNRLDYFLKGQFDKLMLDVDAGGSSTNAFVEACVTAHGVTMGKAITAYLVARHAFPDRLRLILSASKQNAQDFLDFEAEVGRLLVKITRSLEDIERHVLNGREINWSLIEPIISVPHSEDYLVPENPHGTHVASTLCGDIRRGDLTLKSERDDPDFDADDSYPSKDVIGVCPKLSIYDLRVCPPDGSGQEFIVLAALQFIQHLNRDRGKMRVQGVNISLSLPHDLRNFACGRTPVCLESERLISNGVVVVAAAGNAGVSNRMTAGGSQEGYDAISITDPGNAEGVITVGATHKREPHTYGISYFSSRGPTGDGRLKPDIVAPGEKILAAVPKCKVDIMDGTSMAAPHVSGAAASLMARHRELIRQPAKVKKILCDTATDLNRERRFQGAGLVDILRAIQSV